MDNDWEILRHLLEEQGETVQAYLNFALYIHDKYQWRLKYSEHFKKLPSENESARWTQQLTDGQFARLEETAVRLFDEAARKYVENDFAAQHEQFQQRLREVEDKAILREIRKAGGWWRQLGISVVTGIVTPLILALVIILAAQHLLDPKDIADWLNGHLRH